MGWSAALPSPEQFRLWAAISAVAGALERRVWTQIIPGRDLFPNLFTVLIASPGIGKSQAIEPVKELWSSVERPGFGRLHVSPEGLTKAGMLDAIDETKRMVMVANGVGVKPIEYNCMNVPASEFGVLVPAYDNDFLNILNYIYDNPEQLRDKTRTSKSVSINRPMLNILAGTQPGYLANMLPEEAWTMGFMSRVTMIYAGTSPKVQLFEGLGLNAQHKAQLIAGLIEMTKLYGHFNWSTTAQKELLRWYNSGMEPMPEHSRLQHYTARRLITFTKLCTISAASRGRDYIIELEDLTRAKDWLLPAEALMPDVFREMLKRSDAEIIQELHHFLWSYWLKKKEPFHESKLISFIATRAPSEKVLRILDIAERTQTIECVAPKMWQPRPKAGHGLE